MIIIASDHGGFELKSHLCEFFRGQGIKFDDIGTHKPDPVDHPTIVKKLISRVKANDKNIGIVICGTGIGASIMANRTKGIRAAVCHSQAYAQLARAHNNANVLCLGGRFTPHPDAMQIVKVFLQTQFAGGHYARRTAMYES